MASVPSTNDDRPENGLELWVTDGWLARATAWIDERLAAQSLERTGELTQPHLRPWATVLTAPTSGGRIWMKAASAGTAFEVGVYEVLEQVVPEHVLTPIATDRERGWMLLPDGGVPLGERVGTSGLADAMETALPAYAELQIAVSAEAENLLAAGVPDMRPAAMPGRFEEALDAAREFAEAYGDDGDRATLVRLEGARPLVAEWCERLAVAPVAASIDHNDLHGWNVLEGEGGAPRFYDWGDSVISHPFASMLLGLGFVGEHILEVEPTDERVVRLRDAYLEPFSDYARHRELVETLELACRVGKIARALIWARTVRADPGEERWRRSPFLTLAAVFDESHLSSA